MAGFMTQSWVRTEDAQESAKATFPELFFDLVFVFALIQLSHTLASDFGATAVIEAVILIMAIWWVWIYTTWVTNLLDPRAEPVRLMLFAVMFLGVILAIALPEAFGQQGLTFAAMYCAMQIGRSLFAAYAFRGVDDDAYRTFLRITVWLALSGVFWIAGALCELELRIVFWCCAIGIEYLSPVMRYRVPLLGQSSSESLNVSGEHMAERCALFVIICLGETILTTGRTASQHMSSPATIYVLGTAFFSTVIMWWIYFHHGQEKASEKIEETSEPEQLAQNLFTYGHLPIIAGIILTAVGEEFSLSHPHDTGDWRYAIALLGGPALFLIGNIWVKIAAARAMPVSHFAGLALLALSALSVVSIPVYAVQLLATVALFVTALWEYLALRWKPHQTA